MKILEEPTNKQQELWEVTKFGVQIEYPICHFDPSTPFDPVFKTSIEEVIEDIQFWDLKWDERARIIDSSGKVFISDFEPSKNMDSGVFPGEVERQMDLEETKQMFEICLEFNKALPDRTSEILLPRIAASKSIKEIFVVCERFFQ